MNSGALRGVLDSGAEVHAGDVSVVPHLTDLVSMRDEGVYAVSAFGEQQEVEAKGDLSPLLKDLYVVKGMPEILVSVPQLASEGHWVIFPPADSGFTAAAYVVKDSDASIVGVAGGDMKLDLNPEKSTLPAGRVQLPVFPWETSP